MAYLLIALTCRFIRATAAPETTYSTLCIDERLSFIHRSFASTELSRVRHAIKLLLGTPLS